MSTVEERAKIAELQVHDGHRINDELSVYRVFGGLLYITYKQELLGIGTIKEIKRVSTSSTFVPYKT